MGLSVFPPDPKERVWKVTTVLLISVKPTPPLGVTFWPVIVTSCGG